MERVEDTLEMSVMAAKSIKGQPFDVHANHLGFEI
jgi:hypothetical protein